MIVVGSEEVNVLGYKVEVFMQNDKDNLLISKEDVSYEVLDLIAKTKRIEVAGKPYTIITFTANLENVIKIGLSAV